MATLVEPTVETVVPAPTQMIRHILEFKPDGTPYDKCLCGHIWDKVFVSDGPVCEECADILRKRFGAQ